MLAPNLANVRGIVNVEDHFVKPDAGLSDLDLRHLLDAIGTDVHRVVAVLELHFHSQLSVADHHLIGKNVKKRRRKTMQARKKQKDYGTPKQAKKKGEESTLAPGCFCLSSSK